MITVFFLNSSKKIINYFAKNHKNIRSPIYKTEIFIQKIHGKLEFSTIFQKSLKI